MRDLIGAQVYFKNVLAELRVGWKDLSPVQQKARIEWASTIQTLQRDVETRLAKMSADAHSQREPGKD